MLTVRPDRPLRALALMAVVSLPLATRADEPSQQPRERETIEGVIVRCEPRDKNDNSSGRRLTINTAAVWRDYVRDTATKEAVTPEKASERGDDSVATKGQPKSPTTTVTVDLPAGLNATLRYRTAMDERSLGSSTVEAARQVAVTGEPDATAEAAAKRLDPEELKPGLWIHVRCRQRDDRNVAYEVIVLEPVRDTTQD